MGKRFVVGEEAHSTQRAFPGS